MNYYLCPTCKQDLRAAPHEGVKMELVLTNTPHHIAHIIADWFGIESYLSVERIVQIIRDNAEVRPTLNAVDAASASTILADRNDPPRN